MAEEPIPNFFIIGAAKCGTTSLHFYLDQHPEIAMTRVKEPGVFSEPRYLERLPGYEGLFNERAARMGESSTSYTRYPAEGDAPPLIHAAAPYAKLIYLVRDPVERMISDYVHHFANGHERRSIAAAFADYENPQNYYACTSRYAMQIGRYLEYFDPASLLVLEQDELRVDRERTLGLVFEFLGVDPEFSSADFRTDWLASNDFVTQDGFGQWLRASVVGRTFRRLPARRRLPVARRLRQLFFSTVPRPTLDPVLRAELTDYLRPEVEQLRAMSGRPLSVFAGERSPST